MTEKTEYELVQESIANRQQRLEQVRSMTASSKHIEHIDAALFRLEKLHRDLERRKPATGVPWMPPEGLDEALRKAEQVENQTHSWHSLIGWIWFAVFALGLLALAGSYIYFHWISPVTVTEKVGDQEITRNVYFWKDTPLRYAEVAFWTAFGLLTFILYNLQHWVRQKSDVGVWSRWYLSKLLQGPFIAFVIVLFFVELKFTIAGLDVDFSKAPMPIFIILAFILGYYSDRARDYLDVIRDRFLSGTDVPQVEIESPKDDSVKSTNMVVVRGKATGPAGMAGTIVVGTKEPVAITLDTGGKFAQQVELSKGMNLIKVEVKSPNGKVGSASVQVTQAGPEIVLNVAPLPEKTDTASIPLEGSVKDNLGTPMPNVPNMALD